jgi:hypothetical protein
MDVLAGLPDGRWRRHQELDLQMALRPALTATNGASAAEVGQTLARARARAQQINRVFHLSRSEHKLALPVAEQIEKIGEARNDAAAQFEGRRDLG